MNISKLFRAYYDCRKNKRSTVNAIRFEMDYESHLIQLHQDIMNRTYTVGKSIAFIVNHPVKREIFAGDFRDRIVHHYIIHELNPIFEKIFIHDSYSCRVGKGTAFGIRRMEQGIRAVSDNFTREAWVLKLDIMGFFMSIDRSILLTQIEAIISEKYKGEDVDTLRFLIRAIIANDPTKNCTIKGKRTDWVGLPRNKSLFFVPQGIGIPIGNLTSQIFANLYLHPLDQFIKTVLKIRHYGRYVDDFVLMHHDRDFLLGCVAKIREFLRVELGLLLHPNKILLHRVLDGFLFLGAYIKPHRSYVGNRTKNSFLETIQDWNTTLRAGGGKLEYSEGDRFLSFINSYLGIMKHYSSYRLRKKMLISHLSAFVWNSFVISGGYNKIQKKTKKFGISYGKLTKI